MSKKPVPTDISKFNSITVPSSKICLNFYYAIDIFLDFKIVKIYNISEV